MKNGKIALGVSVIVLAVLAAMLAVVLFALAQPQYPADSTYFMPEHSTGEYCQNNTIVQIRVNTSISSIGGSVDIYFDPNCVNITAADFTNTRWGLLKGFTNFGNYVRISSANFPITGPAYSGDNLLANITLHCINDTGDCTSYPNFSNVGIGDSNGDPIIMTTHNGTITCGVAPPPEETYTKYLVTGWNLISLPLTPTTGNESTSKVLETVSYDAVYRYNATSKEFENVTGTTMESGIGYFVHVTTTGTWTYNGTAYTSMDISLKQGLNMVGWLNCNKTISDGLSSIAGNYNYVASWNATAALPSFETFNPVAPAVFNDFEMMERGTGYFISAKEETTLNESCA